MRKASQVGLKNGYQHNPVGLNKAEYLRSSRLQIFYEIAVEGNCKVDKEIHVMASSFALKLHAWHAFFFKKKKDTIAGIFLWILRFFSEHFFNGTTGTAFEY